MQLVKDTNAMRRFGFALASFILCILLTGGFACRAGAEETRSRLFTLTVNDGKATVKVPVYEYRDGEQVRIAPASGQQTVTVSRGVSKAQIKVKKQTAYFKANYTAVSVKKNVKLAPSRKVKVKATAQDGTVCSTTLTITSPPLPSITSVKCAPATVSIPGETLKATIVVNVQETLTCSVKIKNSSGKLVYSGTVGTAQTSEFIFYWDGTASAGNKAGYGAGSAVPAGTYKLTASIKYTDSGKTATASKTKSFKVKRNSTASSGTMTTDVDASALKSSPWPWTVILTGNKRDDYLAEVICRKILKPTMTEYQRAKAIYTYMCTHYHRWTSSAENAGATEKIDTKSAAALAGIKAYQKTTKKMIAAGTAIVNNVDAAALSGFSSSRYNQIYIILAKQIGDCYYAAMGLEALLRHAGIESNMLHNTFTNNYRHYWSTIRMEDGKWYMADAGMEGRRYDEGAPFTASHFLRGKNTMTKIDDHILHSTIDPDPTKGYVEAYAQVSKTDYPGRGK